MNHQSNIRAAHRTLKLILHVVTWSVVFILLFGAINVLMFQIEAIRFRYPLDYGEAPLLNQAVLINSEKSIYRDAINESPFIITNYPPVYVLLLSFFERIFGPAFWYGRLISTLSALGSGAIIGLMSYSRSRILEISLIAGLLFVNIPYMAGWSSLARIDHLALFLALSGLLIIFRERQKSNSPYLTIYLGGALLILAIYSRQSYALAAPLAGFLFLISQRWKRGFLLAAFVGGSSLILFLLINWLTQGGFYYHIVTANINPFGVDRLILNFQNYFRLAPFLFILGVTGLLISIRGYRGWPMVVGFAMGGFLNALTIGKVGSNVNYFLELSAGFCLAIGFGLVILFKKSEDYSFYFPALISIILLGWQSLSFINSFQSENISHLNDRKFYIEELESLENLVKQQGAEPVLADEYMGMIVLSQQELYLQPFEITQLASAGLFDAQILIDEIESGKFSLILLQENDWWEFVLKERWPPEVLSAIRNNYRLVGQFENTNAYKHKDRTASQVPTTCPSAPWVLPTRAQLGFHHENGSLTFYGMGPEGTTDVTAIADGIAFRPEGSQIGSIILIHNDPIHPGQDVIVYYENLRSYRSEVEFIDERYIVENIAWPINQGEVIGYQGMWSGKLHQQGWPHVRITIAPYHEDFLVDAALLQGNALNPSPYFGLDIDSATDKILPIRCLP